MRVTFFLVVVLILACFLPQGVSAQRRHSYGKNTVSHRGSKVKKTSIVRKARKRASTPSVTNPLLGVLIKQDVATVVPRCTEDSTNLVINIYSKELFFEPMKLEDGKILAFHQDVTKISEGSSMGSNMISKDSRWSPSFSNPKDLELAQKFEQEFSPTRMEFYPKLARPYSVRSCWLNRSGIRRM